MNRWTSLFALANLLTWPGAVCSLLSVVPSDAVSQDNLSFSKWFQTIARLGRTGRWYSPSTSKTIRVCQRVELNGKLDLKFRKMWIVFWWLGIVACVRCVQRLGDGGKYCQMQLNEMFEHAQLLRQLNWGLTERVFRIEEGFFFFFFFSFT